MDGPDAARFGLVSADYILSCAQRVVPRRVCVEFRNSTWMDSVETQKETLNFLASYELPYVCVDMPQGHPTSIPPVLAVTAADLAVLRLHGHSDKWDSKDIYQRFGYWYSQDELRERAANVYRRTFVKKQSFIRTYGGFTGEPDKLAPGDRSRRWAKPDQ